MSNAVIIPSFIATEGTIINGVLNGEVNCLANGLDLNEMAISFWVKGNENKNNDQNINQMMITKIKGYEIGAENKLLKFVFGSRQEVSEEELGEGWNHIVISISPAVSKIYVNKEVKQKSNNTKYWIMLIVVIFVLAFLLKKKVITLI